jgi:phosphate-selective porin OprO and OprP
MKANSWKAGVHLAFALAGFAFTALPQAARAQEPARTTPVADLDARLRKLEELNAKLEKQNDKLAEQNERLEKQNQLIQTAAPGAVKPDEVKNLVDDHPKGKDETKTAANGAEKEEKAAGANVVGADPVFKTTWKDGFVAETANKDFRVHIGGRFQEDFGWFAPNNAVNQAIPGGFADGADIRRARLRMDGTIYEMIDFVLEYEFANSTSTVLTAAGPTTVGVTLPGGGSLGATGNGAFSTNAPTDVYFDIKHLPGENRFRVGHFKEPFSLDDYGTSDSYLTFLERSTPSDSFSPNRNLGVMLWNDPFEQRVIYGFGAFKENSNNSFANAFDYSNGSYAYTGRVGVNPWYENDGRCVLFLGGAYSYRTLDPTISLNRFGFANRIPLRIGSPTIISTGTLSATDTQLFNAQGALTYGSFSLQSEYYAAQGEDVVRGSIARGVPRLTSPDLYGYYIQASYFLTGEYRPYLRDIGGFGRVRPNEPFYLASRCGLGSLLGRGAWEIAARYEDVNDRSGAFNAFPAVSGVAGSAVPAIATTGEERDVTLGLNWYLNPNVKIQSNYVHALRNVANPALSGTVDAFAVRFALDF